MIVLNNVANQKEKMEYFNGQLILSEEDQVALELVTMKTIELQYVASYFIGSMREIKLQAFEKIEEIEQAMDVNDRSSLQVELILQLIDVCDRMIVRAVEAAAAKNCTILML